MMRIEGPALELIRTSLGAVGVGAQITEFPDGIATQVIDVGGIICRGRAPGPSQGLFGARITNSHGAGGALSTSVDPYLVAAPGAGWPSPMPPGVDVWVLSAWASAAIGVAHATQASRFVIQHPAAAVAFGAAGTVGQIVRLFLGETPISGAVAFLREAGSLEGPYVGPAVRVPRGATLLWASNAAAAGDMIIEMELGLFASGLKQDGRS